MPHQLPLLALNVSNNEVVTEVYKTPAGEYIVFSYSADFVENDSTVTVWENVENLQRETRADIFYSLTSRKWFLDEILTYSGEEVSEMGDENGHWISISKSFDEKLFNIISKVTNVISKLKYDIREDIENTDEEFVCDVNDEFVLIYNDGVIQFERK